jgi:tRNA(fMet)-specific endonuclease VapC
LLRKVREPNELARVYNRLAEAIPVLARWPILPMPESAIKRYEVLKAMNLNVRKMDLRIAAIVLEMDAILVTRNVRDFRRVPNLMIENWAP